MSQPATQLTNAQMAEAHRQQQAAAQSADPQLFAFYADIKKDRERLRERIKKVNDDATRGLYVELNDTALKTIEDLTGFLLQTRLWVNTQINELGETVNDLEVRLDGMEEPETQFTQPDAQKFDFVVQAAKQLAELGLKNPAIDAAERDMLQKVVLEAEQCLTIIEDSTLEEGDDEGEEGEADEDEEK